MYSAVLEWNIFSVSVSPQLHREREREREREKERKFVCFNVSFKTSILLLVFSLDEAFIDVSGMLKSPTSIVLLSISPFMLVNIFALYI